MKIEKQNGKNIGQCTEIWWKSELIHWQTASINKVHIMKNCFNDNGTNKEACSDEKFAWSIEGKHMLIEVINSTTMWEKELNLHWMQTIQINITKDFSAKSCIQARSWISLPSLLLNFIFNYWETNSEGLFRWELQLTLTFPKEKDKLIEQQLKLMKEPELIWWKLQRINHQTDRNEQKLKFHNKRIWNLHWRREWC